MAKKGWYPRTIPGQVALYTNVLAKIANYQAILGLTPALVAHAWVDSISATKISAVEWRDMMRYGEPEGDPLPAAPVFAVFGALTGAIGILPRFKKTRDLIVEMDDYTEAIGNDLMYEGVDEAPAPEGTLVPALLVATAPGYKVKGT